MKEEKSEPAKVIGKVDLKKDGKRKGSGDVENAENLDEIATLEPLPETPSDPVEGDHFSHSAAAEDPPETQDSPNDVGNQSSGVPGLDDIDPAALESIPASLREAILSADEPGDSMRETIERFQKQDKAEVEGRLYPSFKSIDFPSVKPTVNQKVQALRWFMLAFMFKGMIWIGRYLLHYEFGGDIKRALSKNAHKGTSISDIAKHKHMPLTRQRICECIRLAGFDAELESLGIICDGIPPSLLLEASRLEKQEDRVAVIKRAQAESLTVAEVRKLVRQLTGKPTSSDRHLGKAVMRQIAELARLATDEDTKDFILDKERLRAALTPKEAFNLLDESMKCRGAMDESGDLLRELEGTLREIVRKSMETENSEVIGSASTASN